MDRLTMTSDKGGLAFTFDLDFRCKPSEARKILALGERLKAYEDTGLEPSEIKTAVMFWGENAAQAQAQLSAYRTAEEQGLLVRFLPIDKRVFIVEDGEIFEFRVYQYSLLSVNNKNVRYWAECISDENEDDLDFWQDEIGKAVFLTREEAERALKGGE